MCLAAIGGMDRLEIHYRNEGEQSGIQLRVSNRSEPDIGAKLKHIDAVVIFTNRVSHQFKREVLKDANQRKVPVLLQHSCGICAL